MSYKAAVENQVITITGCTACGKGRLAHALALHLGGEIISIDSMKVYRGMDVGTAKPPAAARAEVPYHLIDVADPWEPFSAARFAELADQAVEQVHARSRPVVAVGGTVLYLKCWYQGIFAGPGADPAIRAEIRRRAASEGLDALHAELARADPEAAARIHRNDLRRIERALEVYHLTGRPISELQRQWGRATPRRTDWRWVLIGLRRDREEVNRRINARVKQMLAAGLVEEARRIWSDPRGVGPQARQAVGYAELFEHFAGRWSLEEGIERIKIHSRRLAKQQRTWLKRLPKVHWLEASSVEDTADLLPLTLDHLTAAWPAAQ
jgi:tRNA dimethylallyltransferase